MASSSFRISIVANTLSSFSINALSLGSNRVYVINIMYISLDNSYNAFYTLSIDYNSFVIFRFYIYRQLWIQELVQEHNQNYQIFIY